ncbi:MAG: DUF4258 domain-containing protein [Candidatus Doudnabacteria bacterium]|nr:DUF4258 domain-containing protein [Candidatus Doudnabacteria bacterium]
MKVIFTRHAKNRMRWRGINVNEVIRIIQAPDKKELLANKKFHYYKTVNSKYLRATLAFENDGIIIISVVDKKD